MFCTSHKEEHDRLEHIEELVARETNECESLGTSRIIPNLSNALLTTALAWLKSETFLERLYWLRLAKRDSERKIAHRI